MIIPSAHHVATAIVAAARITGADPERIATGMLDSIHEGYKVSRARLYAALALTNLFPRCPAVIIARLVGVTTPSSATVYVKSWQARIARGEVKWFSNMEPATVISALLREMPPSEPEPYRPPPGTVEKVLAGESKPALGSLEPDGYRPPEGTVKRVLQDDKADDRPVLGRNDYGAPREHRDPFTPERDSKRRLEQMLANAVRNTAAMKSPKGQP